MAKLAQSSLWSDLNVASQTDVYDRLDVYDGYEILVAGTEDMNYNVKYKTDHNDSAKDAEDSKVTEYTNVVFKSMTRIELNDATVYGETPNVLDWTLELYDPIDPRRPSPTPIIWPTSIWKASSSSRTMTTAWATRIAASSITRQPTVPRSQKAGL